MKDIHITITAKKQRTELMILGCCLLFAFLLNVFSILIFQTEWKELYTQLIWVLCLGLGFYFLILFIQIIVWFIKYTIRQKKEKK